MTFRLFHASPARFDQPDFETALGVICAPASERNPKGAIGLWSAPFPCEGFGPETASFRLADDARYVSIRINSFKGLYYGLGDVVDSHLDRAGLVQAFVNFREALSPRADVLLIDDTSGRLGEVVILNLDVIRDWTWHPTSELVAERAGSRSVAFSTVEVDEQISAELCLWSFAADGSVEKPKAPRP